MGSQWCEKSFMIILFTLMMGLGACHNASTGIHKNDFDSVHEDSGSKASGNYNGNAAGSMTMDSLGKRTDSL